MGGVHTRRIYSYGLYSCGLYSYGHNYTCESFRDPFGVRGEWEGFTRVAYIVMAYIVAAYIVMAITIHASRSAIRSECVGNGRGSQASHI